MHHDILNRILKEEIARSHQTVDNDPVQYDEHPDVDVEMYANDDLQWSCKVTCVSDPSLSFPMQKFPDEYSAQHYARQCADRIIRKRMNEEKLMKKQYSIVEQIYSSDEILTESILAWIAGLIGLLLQQWMDTSEETTKETVSQIQAAAEEALPEISKNELGKEVESFDDLDLSDPKARVVVYKAQAKYDYEKAKNDFVKHFSRVSKVKSWFPPEGEKEQKVWGEKEGKAIQNSIYAYGGFCIAELEWWKKFGFKVKEDHAEATNHVKNNTPEFGSAYKWALYIKNTLNEQCKFYWNYALDNLDVKEAKEPLSLHHEIMRQIESLLPALKEASENKAKEAPPEAKDGWSLEENPEAPMTKEQAAELAEKLNDESAEKEIVSKLGFNQKGETGNKLVLMSSRLQRDKDGEAKYDGQTFFASDIESVLSDNGHSVYIVKLDGEKYQMITKNNLDKLSDFLKESRIRRLVRNLILESLADDLASVSSGRGAKKKFAEYVDQEEFKKGTIVHWVGSTSNLKKIIANPQTKDELSCNFYPNGGYRDWMAKGPKKPIGVIVEGWVTYAGKENMFTGYSKRPRKKADKAKYDHRKASSGINKYPYEIWKNEEDYLEHLRDPSVPQTKAEDMEPYGVKRDMGDDAWMFGMMGGSSKKPWQDWNEILVDNWKITGVVYGGVGRYGLSERMVRTIKQIAKDNGLLAHKMGKMT